MLMRLLKLLMSKQQTRRYQIFFILEPKDKKIAVCGSKNWYFFQEKKPKQQK